MDYVFTGAFSPPAFGRERARGTGFFIQWIKQKEAFNYTDVYKYYEAGIVQSKHLDESLKLSAFGYMPSI